MQLIQRLLNSFNLYLEANWKTILFVFLSVSILYFTYQALKRAYIIRLNDKYIKAFKWKVFELKFPKENLKSPKAMEQVFASLHGMHSFGFNKKEIWIDGQVEPWMSLEMIGRAHEARFYARVRANQKNQLEAAFFAQYPEVEIIEVPDPMNDLPAEIPDDTYDAFLTDFELGRKEHEYPLKTYEFFESPDEEKQLDPMSTVAEAISGLKDDEIIVLQIIIAGTGPASNPKWGKAGEKIINKLSGRKEKAAGPGVMAGVFQFFGNIVSGMFAEELKWGAPSPKPDLTFHFATHVETEIIKAIGEKMSKAVFDTIIRFAYIDRKDAWSGANIGAVMSAMQQFNTANLNYIKPSNATQTKPHKIGSGKWPWNMFFRKTRFLAKKRKMYHALKTRETVINYPIKYHKFGHLHLQTNVLASHELATMFHPPSSVVGAQKLGQLAAKKAGPPMGLPIIE